MGFVTEKVKGAFTKTWRELAGRAGPGMTQK